MAVLLGSLTYALDSSDGRRKKRSLPLRQRQEIQEVLRRGRGHQPGLRGARSAAVRHLHPCCDGWVKGTILGHEMKPGQPCHFRGEGCCTIYERRPVDPCRNFICGWLQEESPFPEEFKPERLGVLIIPVRWRTKTAYILRSAGRHPDEALL